MSYGYGTEMESLSGDESGFSGLGGDFDDMERFGNDFGIREDAEISDALGVREEPEDAIKTRFDSMDTGDTFGTDLGSTTPATAPASGWTPIPSMQNTGGGVSVQPSRGQYTQPSSGTPIAPPTQSTFTPYAPQEQTPGNYTAATISQPTGASIPASYTDPNTPTPIEPWEPPSSYNGEGRRMQTTPSPSMLRAAYFEARTCRNPHAMIAAADAFERRGYPTAGRNLRMCAAQCQRAIVSARRGQMARAGQRGIRVSGELNYGRRFGADAPAGSAGGLGSPATNITDQGPVLNAVVTGGLAALGCWVGGPVIAAFFAGMSILVRK